MNIAREILEKHLNKDLDIKTYLKGSALTYEVVLDAIEEAINYTRCCTELNNCFKVGEIVIYNGVKMRITFIDNCQKIAHMYCMCDETDWKEVRLNKLTKII